MLDKPAFRPAIDAFNRTFTRVHTWVYVNSRGWVGHRWTLVPSLILHTTGRTTGLPRSVVLVYAKDLDKLLIVPSNFGKDRPPAWLLNLKANAAAEVNVGHHRVKVQSDVIEPADDRYPHLFAIANDSNRKRFDRYTGMTDRSIPVIVLSPCDKNRAHRSQLHRPPSHANATSPRSRS